MGQKVHPTGFRLLNRNNWVSQWNVNSKLYNKFLHEDEHIRNLCINILKQANHSDILIQRGNKSLTISLLIYTGSLNNPLQQLLLKQRKKSSKGFNESTFWETWIKKQQFLLTQILTKYTKNPKIKKKF